jgi:serine phosphatase RsbU (regulator of sigma subunit)
LTTTDPRADVPTRVEPGFAAFLERLRLPVCVTDLDGVVVLWSPPLAEALGIAAAGAVGRLAVDLGVSGGRFLTTVVDNTVVAILLDQGERLLAADRAAERLARLQSITALLSGARTRDDVCTIVVHQGMAGLGAENAVLCLVTDDGAELEIAQAVGIRPETRENWNRFPIDAPVPACDALRSHKLVLFSSLEERDRMYPLFAGQPSANQAYATVPLHLGGRDFGAVTFGWADPREFATEDRQFLMALAEQCSQALDRCRLYDAEARERRRKEFVAEASALLTSSLDYQTTIDRVARLLVPDLADACVVHVRTVDGLELVTAAHVDPEHERLLRSLGDKDDHLATHFRLIEVTNRRRPMLVPEIPPGMWDDAAGTSEERAQLQRLGLRSGLAVPLMASGECVGVLSMAMSVSGRTYSNDDVATAQDIAGRAAVAIQNARRHRALLDISQTLQRSLLPAERPHIPGLDVAAVYHPVSDSEVGGDFYDVFPVAPGKWGVVVGDVCGKGVQAASLTALARYTVRAAAVGAESPSQVLRRLNQAVLDEGADERFCTLAYLVVEPGESAATVTLACGGHPLPLVVGADGSRRSIGRPGSAIGMFPEPDLVDTVHTLNPGESVVLFTDGVLEARSPEGSFEPDLLDAALGRVGPADDAAALAASVERAVLSFQGGASRDDMAVLVVRVPNGR